MTHPASTPGRGICAPLVLALVHALTSLSCGLETVAFLSEKVTVLQSSNSALTLRGPNIENSPYDGQMIFYKIYATDVQASTDLSAVRAKQDAANAIPGQVVESYLISSNGLKYQQLVLDGDIPIPSIKKGLLLRDYYAAIEFPAGSGSNPTLTVYNEAAGNIITSHILKRIAKGADGAYISFKDRPQNGDADYLSSTNDTDPNVYYVQLFAASYGLDLSDFSDLYGDAVFLTCIALNF